MAEERDPLTGARDDGATPTAGYDPQGKAPRQIHSDIRHTRSEMSETMDALGAKFDPDHLKEEAKDALRSTARDARRSMIDTIKENPFPAAIAGLSVAWLLFGNSNDHSSSHSQQGDRAVRHGVLPPLQPAARCPIPGLSPLPRLLRPSSLGRQRSRPRRAGFRQGDGERRRTPSERGRPSRDRDRKRRREPGRRSPPGLGPQRRRHGPSDDQLAAGSDGREPSRGRRRHPRCWRSRRPRRSRHADGGRVDGRAARPPHRPGEGDGLREGRPTPGGRLDRRRRGEGRREGPREDGEAGGQEGKPGRAAQSDEEHRRLWRRLPRLRSEEGRDREGHEHVRHEHRPARLGPRRLRAPAKARARPPLPRSPSRSRNTLQRVLARWPSEATALCMRASGARQRRTCSHGARSPQQKRPARGLAGRLVLQGRRSQPLAASTAGPSGTPPEAPSPEMDVPGGTGAASGSGCPCFSGCHEST